VQTNANRVSLDSSAIVKLVIRESETDALVRTLDAIHLAAARRLAPDIDVITYDHRLRDAAEALGLTVLAPAP
jgi:predicted nucleic acid-binding protein